PWMAPPSNSNCASTFPPRRSLQKPLLLIAPDDLAQDIPLRPRLRRLRLGRNCPEASPHDSAVVAREIAAVMASAGVMRGRGVVGSRARLVSIKIRST